MSAPAIIQMEAVSDPDELSKSRTRREAFDRNSDWLDAHAAEIYFRRGKHVCIAGQELFVADTAEDALHSAQSAHPNDEGVLPRYVLLETHR